MKPTLALAVARACGSVAVAPEDEDAIRAHAEEIQRSVTQLRGREVVFGWAAGYGPALDDDTLAIYTLPPTRLVALGIVLALCYGPDRGDRLGRVVPLTDFNGAVARVRSSSQHVASQLGQAHVRGGLVELHEMGLVMLGGDCVGLGRALAAWTPAEWAAVDAAHAQLVECCR